MSEKNPTYHVAIKNAGMPPNKTYGWEIYRNLDVLPILRSQQLFISRRAGLADANRSRLQLVDTDMKNRETKEQ
jgi:hypothetical protein